MLRAALLLCLVMLAAFESAVRAEVRVIDAATGVQRTVMPGETFFEGWTDDGTALEIGTRDRGSFRVALDGRSTPAPDLEDIKSYGPGGWIVRYGAKEGDFDLRAPDGRLVRRFRFGVPGGYNVTFDWAKDGSRLAVVREPTMRVFDTVSGALVMRRRVGGLEPTSQPFAPAGSALLMSDYSRLVRVAVPSGRMRTLVRGDVRNAGWSSTGRIMVQTGRRVRILGDPAVSVPLPRWDLGFVWWKEDGETLMFDFSVASDECSAARNGVAEVVPGQLPRVLVPLTHDPVYGTDWSPDGRTLAVEYGPLDAQQAAHPRWPRRIAHDYSMFSRRGNRAVRAVVLSATRLLRRGAGREETMSTVRHGLTRAGVYHPELYDTDSGEAIADEISGWLQAAGLEPIEARDELTCDVE